MLFALLALGLAACGDVAQDPTGPTAFDAPRSVTVHMSKAGAPSDTMLPPVQTEACTWVLVQIINNADGSRTYVYEERCTTDEGGGGGGGGSGEDPTCDPTAAIGGCDAWGGGGGGGYCPANDPKCPIPLTDEDKRVLNEAWYKMKTQFNTPEAAQICPELRNRYAELYSSGKVFRGGYDSGHDGGSNGSEIHVDPEQLDLAAQLGGGYINQVADIVLHEAAHTRYPNHTETVAPYNGFPYRHVSAGTTAEQCVF